MKTSLLPIGSLPWGKPRACGGLSGRLAAQHDPNLILKGVPSATRRPERPPQAGSLPHDAPQSKLILALTLTALSLILAGCGANAKTDDPSAGAPPPAQVEHEADVNIVKVDHPDRFPLAEAARIDVAPTLDVTGVVQPDVTRNVPVITLATGRILEIHAKLGDTVTKGQLLMRVQSPDIAQAFSDYRQAVADEVLAKAQLDRSKLLFDQGAIAQKDLEVAVDTDAKAKVTVETTAEHLHVLGVDPAHPASIVDVYAPVSGVITDQQVTVASGTQGLASPNAFTISDLTHVWIVCDVYENNLSFVKLGEYADIHLNAYPNLPLRGRIDNIGPILDPNIRTAKVRLQVGNPSGLMRLGMFVTATFHSPETQVEATVPAAAILHLHDRDWVYVPAEGGRFERLGVEAGRMLPGGLQVVRGINPGQRVVTNALVLQNTVEQ
jgi:cobalt-zinc-cadmium efflux system membrane fusion protein